MAVRLMVADIFDENEHLSNDRVASDEVRSYVQLQRRIHDDLRVQHYCLWMEVSHKSDVFPINFGNIIADIGTADVASTSATYADIL